MASAWVPASPYGERRLVTGGSADDLGELVGGVRGAGGVGDPGVVGGPAAGHGDVGVAAGGAGFEDGEADVDGVALVAVTGHGPAELDVAGDVVGGQVDPAAFGVGHTEAAVGSDGLDGPGVAVPHLVPVLGGEARVVASGGDAVAGEHSGAVGEADVPSAGPVALAALDGVVDLAGHRVDVVVIATLRPASTWRWWA